MRIFSWIINMFRVVIGGPLVVCMIIITVIFFTLVSSIDEAVDMAEEIWRDYVNGF